MLALRLRPAVFKPFVRQAVRSMGGGHDDHHHAPNMPPFARLRPPSQTIPEEIELVWDDSVAPETCVDFDAPHVSSGEVLKAFALGISFFLGLYTLVSLTNPADRAPTAHRGRTISAQGYLYDMGLADSSGDSGNGHTEEDDSGDDNAKEEEEEDDDE